MKQFFISTFRMGCKSLMTCLLTSCLITAGFPSFAQWGNLGSGTNRDLYSLFFFNEQTGFAVGDSGIILKTTDFGKSWATVNSGSSQRLNNIIFTSASKGFIAGNKGVLLKSTNGGSSWAAQGGFPNLSLNKVYFINNSDTGIIAGDVGLIMRTTDGGNTWNTISSGVIFALSSVAFANDTLGFIVGGGGTLLKTTDKGLNWTSVNSGTTDILSDIIFTGNNTGYIVGVNGKILKTTDGGANWPVQPSNTTEWLSCIDCFKSGYCIANGSNGASVKTVDGNNWTVKSSGTPDYLQDVKMTDEYTAYSCGFGGTLLKTCPEIIFSWTLISKGTIQFNDSSKNYTQIKWYFGDGDSSTATSPLHTYPNSTSTYVLKIFAANESDCVDSAVIDFIPNGVDELTAQRLKVEVYPNPFSEQTVVRIANGYEFTNYNLQFTMYDLLGRKILQLNSLMTNQPITINQKGIYFYQVTSDGKAVARGKLISQ